MCEHKNRISLQPENGDVWRQLNDAFRLDVRKVTHNGDTFKVEVYTTRKFSDTHEDELQVEKVAGDLPKEK